MLGSSVTSSVTVLSRCESINFKKELDRSVPLIVARYASVGGACGVGGGAYGLGGGAYGLGGRAFGVGRDSVSDVVGVLASHTAYNPVATIAARTRGAALLVRGRRSACDNGGEIGVLSLLVLEMAATVSTAAVEPVGTRGPFGPAGGTAEVVSALPVSSHDRMASQALTNASKSGT